MQEHPFPAGRDLIGFDEGRCGFIFPHPSASTKAEDRTMAIAPEAGSERLRRVVKKGYTEEEILKAVDALVENGLCQIKCYFLIGLPSETDDDVKAILLLAKKIRHRILSNRKDRKARWRLVLSVNPFIPKPATPFQWARHGGCP